MPKHTRALFFLGGGGFFGPVDVCETVSVLA